MGATPKEVGFDPKAWVSRLREVNKNSLFNASERALIEDRLATLHRDLGRPKPFVEECDALV